MFCLVHQLRTTVPEDMPEEKGKLTPLHIYKMARDLYMHKRNKNYSKALAVDIKLAAYKLKTSDYASIIVNYITTKLEWYDTAKARNNKVRKTH